MCKRIDSERERTRVACLVGAKGKRSGRRGERGGASRDSKDVFGKNRVSASQIDPTREWRRRCRLTSFTSSSPCSPRLILHVACACVVTGVVWPRDHISGSLSRGVCCKTSAPLTSSLPTHSQVHVAPSVSSVSLRRYSFVTCAYLRFNTFEILSFVHAQKQRSRARRLSRFGPQFDHLFHFTRLLVIGTLLLLFLSQCLFYYCISLSSINIRSLAPLHPLLILAFFAPLIAALGQLGAWRYPVAHIAKLVTVGLTSLFMHFYYHSSSLLRDVIATTIISTLLECVTNYATYTTKLAGQPRKVQSVINVVFAVSLLVPLALFPGFILLDLTQTLDARL